MREFSRASRASELIRRELAELIRREISVPGAGMITISEVDLSPDLRNAKIYVTIFGGELDAQETLRYLTRAAGHLRYQLSQCVNLRVTPRLSFVYDTSMEYGDRLTALIDSVSASTQEAG
ncbi:MAG: 30S ribosome-binding factor RbfA [Gammaproteobacteria bacterium]|nr:30S ribosome-binding factor RbfA [Gammaproteobacteria bacterium]